MSVGRDARGQSGGHTLTGWFFNRGGLRGRRGWWGGDSQRTHLTCDLSGTTREVLRDHGNASTRPAGRARANGDPIYDLLSAPKQKREKSCLAQFHEADDSSPASTNVPTHVRARLVTRESHVAARRRAARLTRARPFDANKCPRPPNKNPQPRAGPAFRLPGSWVGAEILPRLVPRMRVRVLRNRGYRCRRRLLRW